MVKVVRQWMGAIVLAAFATFINVTVSAEADAQLRAFECEGQKPLSRSEADAAIAQVQTSYAAVSASRGAFSQESYLAALDASESSSGEMWFEKPGKMRWNYTQPRVQEVVVAGGTLWVHQVDKGQVMIESVEQALLSDLPIAFLMGLGDLSRDFTFKAGCRNADGTVLSLVPRSSAQDGKEPGVQQQGGDLSGFDLLLARGAMMPKGAKVTSLGGNVTAIVFDRLRTEGVNPPAGTFVLEYPKGVDILDRRSNPK